jgi:hypothetical protein
MVLGEFIGFRYSVKIEKTEGRLYPLLLQFNVFLSSLTTSWFYFSPRPLPQSLPGTQHLIISFNGAHIGPW